MFCVNISTLRQHADTLPLAKSALCFINCSATISNYNECPEKDKLHRNLKISPSPFC